jgi:glycosyltransferase involved in cell wall biosynthesis
LKILVVHEVSYLKKPIYEFQILPEALSLLGHDVTVVDFDDTWSKPSGRPLIDLSTKVHDNVHRAYPRASITLRHPGIVRLPVVSRIAGAITGGFEIRRTLNESSFDALLLYAVPTTGVQSVIAAGRSGVPVFFRSIDVSHHLVPNRLLAWPTRLLERYVYRGADAVSVLTPRLKDYVSAYGVPPERIEVLPAGVDLEMFSPGEANEGCLSRWGVQAGDPVILFMGTIYRFSGLARVIQDFPQLLIPYPNARLLVVGHGEDQNRLEALALEKGVSNNVIFTGLQPYETLPDIIRSSDICINPFDLNDITRDILPTKLFQYLACGKPLVATELPGTLPFLEGEAHGVIYSSQQDFVAQLKDLLGRPERRLSLGRNARVAMEKKYEWRGIAREMASWMQGFL